MKSLKNSFFNGKKYVLNYDNFFVVVFGGFYFREEKKYN